MEISPEDLRASGKNSRDLCLKLESFGYQIFKTHRAQPHERIVASETSPDFHAINVYCTKKSASEIS